MGMSAAHCQGISECLESGHPEYSWLKSYERILMIFCGGWRLAQALTSQILVDMCFRIWTNLLMVRLIAAEVVEAVAVVMSFCK